MQKRRRRESVEVSLGLESVEGRRSRPAGRVVVQTADTRGEGAEESGHAPGSLISLLIPLPLRPGGFRTGQSLKLQALIRDEVSPHAVCRLAAPHITDIEGALAAGKDVKDISDELRTAAVGVVSGD